MKMKLKVSKREIGSFYKQFDGTFSIDKTCEETCSKTKSKPYKEPHKTYNKFSKSRKPFFEKRMNFYKKPYKIFNKESKSHKKNPLKTLKSLNVINVARKVTLPISTKCLKNFTN